jgi:hypothetical protein
MPYFPGAAPAQEIHYGLHLRKLNESSLSEDPAPNSLIVRFTWLRTFHPPVVLRVERGAEESWQLRTKIGSGAGGYEPGRLTQEATRALTPADVETLQKLLQTGEFWVLPSQAEESGMDGAQWIFEVRDSTRYHYIDRWCPQDGVAYDVGRHLMTLSGYDFGQLY